MALSRGKKMALGLLVALVAAGQIPTQETLPSDPVERPNPVDLSMLLPTNPPRPIQVLFIHHSCGGQLLADHGAEDYEYAKCIFMSHVNGGDLRKRLVEAGFLVNEASYGSVIGDKTDLWDWEATFKKEMERIVDTRLNDARFNGTAANEVVVFKSCYPNNRFGEEIEHAAVVTDDALDAGVEKTLPAPALAGEAPHGEPGAEAPHGEHGAEAAHGEHAEAVAHAGAEENHAEHAVHGEANSEHCEGHGMAHEGPEEEPDLTVSNAQAALKKLLPLFAQRPKTLFIYMTAPPNAGVLAKQPLWKKLAKKAWHKWRKTPTEVDEAKAMGDRARAFNSWVADRDGWLKDYPLKNVLVFDYYDVLTDRGQSNFLTPLFANKIDNTDEHPNFDGNMSAADAFMPFINRAVQRAGLVAPQLTPAARAAEEAAKAAEEAAAKAATLAAEEAARMAALYPDGGAPSPDAGPVAEATPAAEEVPDHLLTPIERKLRHPKRPAKKQLTAGTLSGPPAAVPAPKPEP